jgi:hypothetical protein
LTNQIGGVDGQITIRNFYRVHFAVASAHYCHAQFAVQKKLASRFFQLSLAMALEIFACSFYLILFMQLLVLCIHHFNSQKLCPTRCRICRSIP